MRRIKRRAGISKGSEVDGLGFRVEGLGLRVEVLGFRVEGLGFGVKGDRRICWALLGPCYQPGVQAELEEEAEEADEADRLDLLPKTHYERFSLRSKPRIQRVPD